MLNIAQALYALKYPRTPLPPTPSVATPRKATPLSPPARQWRLQGITPNVRLPLYLAMNVSSYTSLNGSRRAPSVRSHFQAMRPLQSPHRPELSVTQSPLPLPKPTPRSCHPRLPHQGRLRRHWLRTGDGTVPP